MLLNLTEFAQSPIQDQVIDQIVLKIINCEINPGTELEQIGIMAREHRISKNTIKRAYQELTMMGLVEFIEGRGYYVKKVPDRKLNEIKEEYYSTHSTEIDPAQFSNIYNEAAEKHRYEEELKLARKIQADLIPNDPLENVDFSVAAFIEPSRVVCGDFYDYFEIDETQFGMVIADAAGKGMPAAILISQIQAILKSEIGNGSSVDKIVTKLNNHLNQNSSARNFTSLFYGIYDRAGSKFAFVNAGHNYPILVRSDGSFELLKTTGPALGLMKEMVCSTIEIVVEPGDLIVFYTDGITEMMNDLGEQFGEGRLIEISISKRNTETSEIIKSIIDNVKSFGSSQFLKDDMTLMIFKRMNHE